MTFTPTDTTNYYSVSGSVNVTVQSAFDGWADGGGGGVTFAGDANGDGVADGGGGGVTFAGDANGDGVADGMAWLLGSDSPAQKANALLPTAAESGGDLVLNFKLRKSASRGTAVLRLQYSKDLGLADPWDNHTVTVPDTGGTDTSGVVFTIDPVEGQDYHQVHTTIPATAAGGTGKVFVRLSGAAGP